MHDIQYMVVPEMGVLGQESLLHYTALVLKRGLSVQDEATS